MTIITDTLRDVIKAELDDLIEIRHDLHAHPELAYAEHRTSQVVQRELEHAGVEFIPNLAGGTGVLAHLPGRGEQAIGLRADMDALPIHETNDLEYRSTTDGVMHACGHDGHTTILIGAARVLASIAREGGLPRPITFIFQPAEEGGAGAERMVNEGCLDGSALGAPIQHMFGLHGWPRLPLGAVGTRQGAMMAAADTFDITVTGVGCHAAWPHVGRDPVLAAAAIVTALQTICSRNVSALESIVVSVTQLHAGNTYNIITGQAQLAGTVRTLNPDVRQLAERRIREITDGVATAHGCQAEVEYQRGYPITINHPDPVEIFNTVAQETFGPQRLVEVQQPVMGGEDFAYYGRVVPACFFVLGVVPDGFDATTVPQLHQPDFNFNDDAIAIGVEMFCRLALRD